MWKLIHVTLISVGLDSEILNNTAGLLQCFAQTVIQANCKDKIETNFAPFAAEASLTDMINLTDNILGSTRSLWSLFFFKIKIKENRRRRKLVRACLENPLK